MKTIKKSEAVFETGDLIFTYTSKALISKTIAGLSCDNDEVKISHVGCILDSKYIVESLGQRNGVVKNRIQKLLKNKKVKLYLAKPKLTQLIDNEEYKSILESKIGIKYDYLNLFKFQIPKLICDKIKFKQSDDIANNRYICSELASNMMYIRFGIFRNWAKKQYSPIELFKKSQYFEYFELID